MKICKKCGLSLDDSLFNKNGNYLSSYCKDCCKLYQGGRKRSDDRSGYQKKYQKEYRLKNFNDISIKEKILRDSDAPFNIGIYLLCEIEDRNGLLYIKCKKCGKMYNPRYGEVIRNISIINGIASGSNFLYCSDKCKESCELFNKSDKTYILNNSKNMENSNDNKKRKSTNAENNAIKSANKRDGGKCTVCGSECDLQGHHIIPYKFLIGTENEYLIYDTDNIETVCKWCHINTKHINDLSFIVLSNTDKKCSICE